MDLSIIIVTYNSENDIKRCIESIIEKTKNIKYEIVVVDNGSVDSTRKIISEYKKEYSIISLIESENKGFNAGNNQGINSSTGEYIALLNPDTILLNNAFKIIIDNMKLTDNVGACGGALFHEDMSLNMSHGSFPTIKETLIRALKIRNDEKYYLPNMSKKVMEVEFPCGADFVFRRDIIKKIGMMDEDYFLYFDETDYGLKFKKNGYKNYLFTDAHIIHAQGKSTENVSEFAENKFCESFSIYLSKNLSLIEAKTLVLIRIFEKRVKLFIKSLMLSGNRSEIIREIIFYKKVYKSIK